MSAADHQGSYEPGELEHEAEAEDNRKRWLLSLPAVAIILFAAAGPLLVMVVYSFLAPGVLEILALKVSPVASRRCSTVASPE